jgi:hypothetical protein
MVEMPDPADTVTRRAALAFAHQVAELAGELSSDLLGVYLIGSLAHGGFSARYSDIDMALIVQEPLTSARLDRLRQEASAHSVNLTSRLSIFWADKNFSTGRFPPLDRIDTIDHGVALIERQRVMPPRPTLADVRTYLAGQPFENWTRDALRLSALDQLTDIDRKRYLRALLYPARFFYSWQTGNISSNDDAVAFLQRESRAGLDADLIARALQCRNNDSGPDVLFAERTKLRKLVEVCGQITTRTAAG